VKIDLILKANENNMVIGEFDPLIFPSPYLTTILNNLATNSGNNDRPAHIQKERNGNSSLAHTNPI
jgi:hypothetical protein